MSCDVRSVAACEGVVAQVTQQHGALHILVNCAAGECMFAPCRRRFILLNPCRRRFILLNPCRRRFILLNPCRRL